MADATDGYSTMCKKAYSVCGHYNGSTTTGSNPVLTTRSETYNGQCAQHDEKRSDVRMGTYIGVQGEHQGKSARPCKDE